MSHLRQFARTIIDLCIFGIVCFAEFAINYWLEPTRRGFFCHDESLAYPLRSSTVSTRTVIIVALTVPSLVVLCVELFRRLDEVSCNTPADGYKKTASFSCDIWQRLVACYKQLGCYIFGLGLTVVATEVGKLTTGRLRPHFFAVCQPELSDGSSCLDEKNQGHFIENYNCRGENMTSGVLAQVGQSFPSGHSSMSFYAMVYVALYLQATLSASFSKLFKHLLQFVCLIFAWFVALTRISDHWHHWSDVLAGSLLGFFMAFVVAVFLGDLFLPDGLQCNKNTNNNNNNINSQNNKRNGMIQTHSLSNGTVVKVSSPSSAPSSTLPAYTFGTVPYLSGQYGQPYHNYGYVS